MAEALAVRAALQSAILLDISTIKVNSDNQTLIRVINGETHDNEIYGAAHHIRNLSAFFASISFVHVSRAQNVRTDTLGKTTLRAFNSACNGPPLG
ncbi:unnamed protein product [Brassica oleracea var. botrytis]